jgi:alpha-L-fucosidase 2
MTQTRRGAAISLVLGTFLIACSGQSAQGDATDRVIWFTKPASNWQREALPLGNGRLGCMVFGGVDQEQIQLNVDSLWTGDENPSGKYQTPGMGAYQNFGDLKIDFGRSGEQSVTDYRRTLDLTSGVHRVEYVCNSVRLTREMFCSRPDQVIVVHLTADRPGQYTGSLQLHDAHQSKTEADGRRLTFRGQLANGLKYQAQLSAQATGGTVTAEKNRLVFTRCDALTLVVAAGTDYVMDHQKGWRGAAPNATVTGQAAAASAQPYAALRDAHRRDHVALLQRVAIDVGRTDPAQASLPTDQRLVAAAAGKTDPDLEELVFQYGRYLLMGSSRPGSLPANLQGLWNHSNNPPWHCDYHSNINLQMNYWLAEPANLADCHTPLFDLLTASLEPFRQGTRTSFANVRGFTVRTSHNIYGGMGWKWNLPASAWYAQHFWEHYAFGHDQAFLRNVAYPFLREVAEFWQDRLKTLPDGRLVVPGGWSPEHGPVEDGCSYDQQIVWDLFSNYIAAADVLGIDRDFRDQIAALRKELVGPQIGKWGQLQEWMVDRDDPNDRHRHTSHLFAVYPGRQISLEKTPALAKAAKVSLAARGEAGDSRRSWTWPWRCALWARLGEPEKCHQMIVGLLKYNTLPNLLTVHPPMQMDGNFGITAAICEMLLQSHAGTLHLLPALPAAWPNGNVIGLRARGGYEVAIRWADGQLVEAVILATHTGRCTVQYRDKTVTLDLQAGERRVVNHKL